MNTSTMSVPDRFNARVVGQGSTFASVKAKPAPFQRFLVLAAVSLLLVASESRVSRADTILDSGTTTVTTGTTFDGTLFVGSSGTAALEVLIGGSAASGSGYLGYNAGSNGTVTVAGGTWADGGPLYVGYSGVGTLDLDGGLVTSNGSVVGYGTASYGNATVSSGRWENNGTTPGMK